MKGPLLSSPIGAGSIMSNSAFASVKANQSLTPANNTNIIKENKLAVNANYILMTSTRNSGHMNPYSSNIQNGVQYEKGENDTESMG